MTIDTNELRALVASLPDDDRKLFMDAIYRLEAAEKERDDANAAAIGVALQAESLQAKLEVAEEERDEFKRSCFGHISDNSLLRAKIAEMEQQEPYSYIYEYANPIDGSPVWRNVPGYWNAQFPKSSKPLYLLPGAQPAPSVPREAIDKMLTQLMDIAVSNGANSISMPDEYVEVAAWLCGIPAQPTQSVPDGWKLVPIEPTRKMLDAGDDTLVISLSGTPTSSPIAVYRAMLAAAPEDKP